jgi:Transposase DNA-binding
MPAALGGRAGGSLPTAFQDWANTKAACRFFSNGKIGEDRMPAGRFAASALRIGAVDGPILVLQDTTEFSFTRASPEEIGFTKASTGREEADGRFRLHAICGLLMHAGRALIDHDVEILDLATGTFICELIEHFRGQPQRLHANEVAILPYL